MKQCEEFYLHGVNVNVPNAVVTEYVMAESDFDLVIVISQKEVFCSLNIFFS